MKNLALILIIGLFCAGNLQAVEVYSLGVDEWPPYSYSENGVAKGTDIEVLNAVAGEMGIRFEFQFLPWLRALSYAKSGQMDGILSLYNRPDRAEFLYFPDRKAYLSEETIILIKKKGKSLKNISSLEDLKGIVVGVTHGNSYGDQFDQFAGLNKAETLDDNLLVKMLANERTEVALINQMSFYDMVKKNKEYQGVFESLSFIINNEPLYVGFSKKSERIKKFKLNDFNRALIKLHKNGTIAAIKKKYMQ